MTPIGPNRPGSDPPSGSGGHGGGGLRPTRSPAPRPWRRPVEPDVVSDQLGHLIHEFAGLVDGSLRHMGVAIRSIDQGVESRQLAGDTAQRLRTVHAALQRMADALRNAAGAPPMHWLQAAFSASLADAVQYAVGIMEPIASQRRIQIDVDLDASFATLPPGHLYTVVVNAVRNSIESVIASGERSGTISVCGWVEQRQTGSGNGTTTTRGYVCLEVSDSGLGPPPLPEGRESEVFEPQFSTKPGGLGIGLSVSRQIVEGVGGTIELRPGRGGAGATLAISYPVIEMETPAPPP